MVVIGSRIRRRRRSTWTFIILAFLIIVALLAVVNLAFFAFRKLDRPGKPLPGELLYASTFATYNQEWRQFPGQDSAVISDGMLRVTVGSSKDGAYSDLNHEFSDFDIRVNAQWMAVPSRYSELGVLFRYKDPENFYVFKLSADGAYSIDIHINKKVETLSARQLTPAALIGVNTVNQLRIIGQGDHFRFFINDQPVLLCLKGTTQRATWRNDHSGQCLSSPQTSPELIDSTFDYGAIALGTFPVEPGVEVAFGNVLVYGPDTKQ